MRALLLLLCVVALPAEPQAPAPPLDLPAFRAELDRWSAAMTRLESNPQGAGKLRRRLPSRWIVAVPGQQWSVPTAWLDNDLKLIEQDPTAARLLPQDKAYLQQLGAAADEASQLSSAPRLDGSAKLSEILQRPEFLLADRETWMGRLIRRAAAWVIEALRFFLSLGSVSRTPDVSGIFSWILLGALACASLFFLRRHFLASKQAVGASAAAIPHARRRWQEFALLSINAADTGDYRSAIRYAYWAGVYRLEELGAWQVERHRTHREYLRLLPRDSPQQVPLSAITQRFELSWYGGEAATADQFQMVAQQLENLGCLLPAHPTTANS